MNWYWQPWKKFATFNGRAQRMEFWVFSLVNYAIFYALVLPVTVVEDNPAFGSSPTDGILVIVAVSGGLFWFTTVVPSWAVLVRRLHDTGKSGWWVFIGLIPFGSLVILVFTLLDSGPDNAYGPNPKSQLPGPEPPAPVSQSLEMSPGTGATSVMVSPTMPPAAVEAAPGPQTGEGDVTNRTLTGFCIECGAKFDFDDDKFCARCGHVRSRHT